MATKHVLEEPEAVQRFFTANARSYHSFIQAFRYSAGLRAFLARHHYVRPGAKVLDAGCGTGALTRALHQIGRLAGNHGLTIHAFDLTPAMIALLREWLHKYAVTNVAIQQANVLHLEALPGNWRDYDLIVSASMLEYLPKNELAHALRNLSRLLAPDGVLVVGISRNNFLMHGLIRMWWKGNLYDRAELEHRFADAGLSCRFRRFPFLYGHLNLWGYIIEARPISPSRH